MTATPAPQRRLGPILLSPGVTPAQIGIFLVVVLCAHFTTGFINMIQPLLVTELLNVPSDRQGVLVGALTTTQHGAVLLAIGIAGAMSDRLGRRRMLIMALSGFLLCLWFFPLALGVWMLFLLRFFYGVSFTGYTTGAATKMMDYPDNRSRGKFISLMFLVQAGGAAIFMTFVSSRIISWFRDAGVGGDEAIRYGFWALSAVPILGILVATFLLAKDAPKAATASGAAPGAAKAPMPSLVQTISSIGQVFAAARRNPRLALVLLIGGVIRTDSVVLTSFLGLWIIQAGRLQGVDPIEATKTIGLLLAIGQISSFVTPPFFGWLADRIDRLYLLIASLVLTAIAFCSFGLIEDVFGYGMIVVAVMVGLAEGAQSISANALLGEETPPEMRGRAMGVFVFLGTVSVLVISMLAGLLFDTVGFSAPFIMEGLFNLAVALTAIWIIRGNSRRARAAG